jgi:DNA recombination-dependent growth factor C
MESEPFLAFGLVVVALGESELLRDQLAVRLLPKAFKRKDRAGAMN